MDLKKIVMNLRNARGLHGNYPIVIRIPHNLGHIVQEKIGYYIVALTKNNELYFHGLTRFTYKYDASKDFIIKLSPFKKYTFQPVGKNLKQITLINDEDYLPFYFFCNVRTSYESEYNAAYLCREFEKLGIKEINMLINHEKEMKDHGKEE